MSKITPPIPFYRKIGLFLSNANILFYSLPWLMIIIFMGTISQKNLGLFVSTHKYFNSIILWLGPIPTPGGLTTLGLIFISLCVKFFFYSPWQKKKAGIILTHLGILLLLLGGIITAINSKEGFMIIPEGRNVNHVSDYYQRSLTFKNDKEVIKTLNFDNLKKGQEFQVSNLKFKILEKCNNCGARAPSGIYENLQGLAVNMELYPIQDEKQKESNFSGIILDIEPENKDKSGTYMVMEDIPKNPIFKDNTDNIEISLNRKNSILPFSLTLDDFRKINYPGTDKAKGYEADIIVHDGLVNWPVTISMNKPLRYKGYTFYQSSFEQRPDVEVTVLNVVQNYGQAFPYISTLIIFIGLMLHLIIHLQVRGIKND